MQIYGAVRYVSNGALLPCRAVGLFRFLGCVTYYDCASHIFVYERERSELIYIFDAMRVRIFFALCHSIFSLSDYSNDVFMICSMDGGGDGSGWCL